MAKNTPTELQILESLVVDNPDLERLEALLDQFNIFEAIGATQVELRHSDFLAFLLNPDQPHGLGDAFAKQLLQKSLRSASSNDVPITPIDLDIWNLDDLEVRREWRNIDLMLLDEEHEMVVIIENKIKSSEHSNQLQRYWDIVQNRFPTFRTWALYLTPEGDQPSHEDYLPINYQLIAELVEGLLKTRQSTLGPDVYTLMEHYAQMLRRHIVSESEIADLCRRIYRKHQRALDMIYEYRPDLQEEIQEILERVIQEQSDVFEIDKSSKTYIRFGLKEWDIPLLLSEQGWSTAGRILLFTFQNRPERLSLHLYIGPGPEDVRQRLYKMANENPPLNAYRALGDKWNTIFKRDILTKKSYEETTLESLEEEIRKKWRQFIKEDLPNIRKVVQAQDWIQEDI